MKILKLCMCALAVLSIPMPASTIIGTGPLGLLTDAKIVVPDVTSGAYFDSAHSSFNQSYTVLVTGGSGSGLLNFIGQLNATDPQLPLGIEEHIFASSFVSSPFQRYTQTPPGVTGCDFVCNIPFTYGIAESFTFDAHSDVAYSVIVDSGDTQHWKFPIEASINLTTVLALDPGNGSPNFNATIAFLPSSQVPEPSTFFLCLGLVAIIGVRTAQNQNCRSKRVNRACSSFSDSGQR